MQLEELYLSMQGNIARMVARIVPRDEVEDIVQETYIRLRRGVTFHEIRNPRAYLYRTARNLALDSLKKAANAKSVVWDEEGAYAASDPDQLINITDSNKQFRRFSESVDRLPPKAQKVFILKKAYGHSQREISDKLNISERTVENHVALAVRRCAEYMAETA